MIKNKIARGIYFSIGLAALVKKETSKHMDKLVKEGKLRSKDARKVLGKAVLEAKRGGIIIEKMVAAEIKKGAKHAKPIVKHVAKKAASTIKKIVKKKR